MSQRARLSEFERLVVRRTQEIGPVPVWFGSRDDAITLVAVGRRLWSAHNAEEMLAEIRRRERMH